MNKNFFLRTVWAGTRKRNYLRSLRIAGAVIAGIFLLIAGVVLLTITEKDKPPLEVVGISSFSGNGGVRHSVIFNARTIPPERYAEADSVAIAAIRERYHRRTDAPAATRISGYRTRTIGDLVRNAVADFTEQP